MNELDIPSEFIEENKANLGQFVPKSRKTGPYSKHDKYARRNEVFKLHFEYGYSARMISEMMKVHRNTINGDIQFWYTKISKNFNEADPIMAVIKQITRLESQKTRLREYLDKTVDISEKITIERLLFDIDHKIIQIRIKISESGFEVHRLATKWLNDFMKKNNNNKRYLSYFDTILISDKAHEKINQIISKDRRNEIF